MHMAKFNRTNADKILSAVLDDSRLTEYGKYAPYEYIDLETAETSSNPYVVAVAKIIKGVNDGISETALYNEVSNHLKKTI